MVWVWIWVRTSTQTQNKNKNKERQHTHNHTELWVLPTDSQQSLVVERWRHKLPQNERSTGFAFLSCCTEEWRWFNLGRYITKHRRCLNYNRLKVIASDNNVFPKKLVFFRMQAIRDYGYHPAIMECFPTYRVYQLQFDARPTTSELLLPLRVERK